MTRLSSFNSRLKAGFEDLSPQLKEAARWVIDHPTDVALLSMREQARRAGIAPATLTRLAQRLGLRGYDGVRKLFADAVRQRPDSYRDRAEELLVRRDSEGDPALVQDIFASLTQHLQTLSMPESVGRFTAAADIVRIRRTGLLPWAALEFLGRVYFSLCAFAVRRELRARRWLGR